LQSLHFTKRADSSLHEVIKHFSLFHAKHIKIFQTEIHFNKIYILNDIWYKHYTRCHKKFNEVVFQNKLIWPRKKFNKQIKMYTTNLKLHQNLLSTLRDEICGQADRHYLPTACLFHAHHADNA